LSLTRGLFEIDTVKMMSSASSIDSPKMLSWRLRKKSKKECGKH
jgi:hypothetical protein